MSGKVLKVGDIVKVIISECRNTDKNLFKNNYIFKIIEDNIYPSLYSRVYRLNTGIVGVTLFYECELQKIDCLKIKIKKLKKLLRKV